MQQISHHKLYPATAELHRLIHQHELAEIKRLAVFARETEAKPLQKAIAFSGIPLEQPVSDNE